MCRQDHKEFEAKWDVGLDFSADEKTEWAKQVDMFALGVTIHMFCEGRYPVAPEHIEGKMHGGWFVQMNNVGPCRLPELQKFVERCVSRERAKRPSINELLALLEKIAPNIKRHDLSLVSRERDRELGR
jgi:serine/threonine protein kinase